MTLCWNEEETQFKLGVEEIDKKYYLGTEIYHLNLIVRSSYLESLPNQIKFFNELIFTLLRIFLFMSWALNTYTNYFILSECTKTTENQL